jgi:hypothetical protein
VGHAIIDIDYNYPSVDSIAAFHLLQILDVGLDGLP